MRVLGILPAIGLLFGAAGCVGPWKGMLAESKPSPVTRATANEPAELKPSESATVCMTLAESFEKGGKESEALIYYEKARQLSPAVSDKASRRLAILYDRHDQQAKALTEFQALLRKHPKDAGLLNDIGYSYYNRGKWSEAETYLRRSVAADKTNTRAWMNLGMSLAQQEKSTEALEVFSKAVTPAEAHASLAFVLASKPDRKEKAVAEYRQALALEPTLPIAREALDRLEKGTAPTRVQQSVAVKN